MVREERAKETGTSEFAKKLDDVRKKIEEYMYKFQNERLSLAHFLDKMKTRTKENMETIIKKAEEKRSKYHERKEDMRNYMRKQLQMEKDISKIRRKSIF